MSCCLRGSAAPPGSIEPSSAKLSAVQLASALDLATETRDDITFVAADERLLRTTPAEGLTVINPESAAARRR
jgi:hypothetical protein